MSMLLRQSTASQEILLGPFVDSTDGNTVETGLTIANTDIKIWKEGSTSESNKNSGGATHIASGRYYAALDATDTNTLGKLEVNVHVSGALPVRREFNVIPANVYDSLVLGTDNLQVDTTQIGGTSQTARDIGASVLLSPGTGTGQVSLSSGAVTVGTNNDKTGYSISGTITTLDALDTAQDTQHSTTQSAISALNDPTAAAIRAEIDSNSTQLSAILADTNELQGDWVNGGRLDLLLDGVKAVTDNLPNGGALTSLATSANLATVDTVVDAIKAKTDSLTFTDAGKVDATLQAAADIKAAVANKVADHTLRRSLSSALYSSDGDTKEFRSLAGATSKLVNKISPNSVDSKKLDIYETDDTTVLGTQTMGSDSSANPITSLDTD